MSLTPDYCLQSVTSSTVFITTTSVLKRPEEGRYRSSPSGTQWKNKRMRLSPGCRRRYIFTQLTNISRDDGDPPWAMGWIRGWTLSWQQETHLKELKGKTIHHPIHAQKSRYFALALFSEELCYNYNVSWKFCVGKWHILKNAGRSWRQVSKPGHGLINNEAASRNFFQRTWLVTRIEQKCNY